VIVRLRSEEYLRDIGPSGAGKSMLARRLTAILPAMTLAEAIETTRIHRVAGLAGGRTALVATRPFRAPHHPIADAGRSGGGYVPRPGEVSRTHHGVRFLDARPEFRRHVLEVWRPPLAEGVVSIQSRGRPRPCQLRDVLGSFRDTCGRAVTLVCSSREALNRHGHLMGQC